MSKYCVKCLLGILITSLLMTSLCFAQQEIWIKTNYVEDTYSVFSHSKYYCPLGSVPFSKARPMNFMNFEEKEGYTYYYGAIAFKTQNISNIFPFIIEIKGNDWENAVMYIDRDMDFNFSEGVSTEQSLKGSGITGFRCILKLTLTYDIEGHEITKQYSSIMPANFDKYLGATLIPAGGWNGKLKMEVGGIGKEWPFLIVDHYCDGDYSLAPVRCGVKEYKPGSIFIDLNNDGIIEEDVEEIAAGEEKRVGDKIIRLNSIHPTGGEVMFHIEDYAAQKETTGEKEDALEILKKTPVEGKKAPDFNFIDLDGNMVSLSKLKGKVVVLDFWAMWCGPCLRELPLINESYEKHKDRVAFIGISLDTDRKRLESFLKKKEIPWPQYYDGA